MLLRLIQRDHHRHLCYYHSRLYDYSIEIGPTHDLILAAYVQAKKDPCMNGSYADYSTPAFQ
jgi:hypothetical protein